jgi:hypothetical protein
MRGTWEIMWKEAAVANFKAGEISGSYGNYYEDECLLGCCAM